MDSNMGETSKKNVCCISFFQRDMVPSVFPTEELLRGRNLKGDMKRQSRSIVAEEQDFALRTNEGSRGRWRIVPVDLLCRKP